MKKLTKNNLIKLIELKKNYNQNKNIQLLKTINNYIENCINKNKNYYIFLSKCNFNNEQLKYLL